MRRTFVMIEIVVHWYAGRSKEEVALSCPWRRREDRAQVRTTGRRRGLRPRRAAAEREGVAGQDPDLVPDPLRHAPRPPHHPLCQTASWRRP